jgi:hypothetical protein
VLVVVTGVTMRRSRKLRVPPASRSSPCSIHLPLCWISAIGATVRVLDACSPYLR